MNKVSRDNSLIIKIITFSILTFGLIMVYDASNIWANYKFNDSFYYLKRQLIFATVGAFIFYIASRISIYRIRKYTKLILIVSLILLDLDLIPGIGQVRNGSRSWFGIGAFGFQPSELFKIALIIYAADFLERHYDKSTKLKEIMPLLVVAILGFGLVMFEPDFGTGLVTLAGLAMLLFVTKLRSRYYVIIGGLAVGFFIFLIVSAPYRFDRIVSFLNPYEDPLGTGFQIIQSLYAIGPGGLSGFGFLNSMQQHYYLPEPQTDFIFAIVVSNFGFLGAVLILITYGYLFFCSYKLAINMDDLYSSLLKIGLTNSIVIQTLINLCVVVGLLPVTGITLPLLSYGGSSLVITLFSLGIISNIKEEKDAFFNISK